MKYRVDTIFYRIGKIIWIPVLIAGNWFVKKGFLIYGELFACSVYKRIGIPCPGCGGTRALYYLFLGEIGTSFTYHPAILYGILAYLHFMLLYLGRKYVFKSTRGREIHIELYIYGAVFIIILQWIIKLLYFL